MVAVLVAVAVPAEPPKEALVFAFALPNLEHLFDVEFVS